MTRRAPASGAKTPAGVFRLPAEWEPHEATILAWPVNKADWPGKFAPIPWVFAEILRHLTPSEPVHLLIPTAVEKPRIAQMLRRAHIDLGRVEFLPLALDRGWMRDCSPAFVTRRVRGKPELGAVHFGFNAWAKYGNWRKDAKAAVFLTRHAKAKAIDAMHDGRRVVLEGGAIDANGAGTLLTTEECLLDAKTQVRNPGFAREDYEAVFAEHLGIRKVLWLGKGIAGDDTHGHVDDVCRFVDPATVVLCLERSRKDANYRALQENHERLRGATNADGRKIACVPLPMPAPVIFDGVRLPASYANFYIANDHVLVPTFNDPADRDALGLLAELFPKRKVVGIHAVDLVWGLGTLHCLTHELPAR
jgi:agmatine deiminase